ncbi:YjbE family putative metal transport protein [Rhodoblastus sp. 17X3]|uniref:YjbE family putative metal transport protein n=1 Tax=Rhodoblastus sp. 17X3 TaxID=3047026 RepID=UPI0024B6B606|nr:YjbE family putative metal transport protein [Rhodoblastus sp. 17X3]MDI9849806.1 YjbE family putative metal transport protein [Rhodoblastus sp. 17X3]
MDGAAAASTLGVLLQILLLDLLLSGDNALLIALACRRLPEKQARRAAWMGAAGAIVLRLVLTSMTGVLMALPFLQLLSALPLLVIALNLMNGEDEGGAAIDDADDGGQESMLAAASVIIVSDAAMSLDNVIALAAVSGGKFWLLAFGLAVSIPLIVFGSFGFSSLLRAYPRLADIGAAMLGWVAGGMIVADPLFAGWVRTQAPALELALPLACGLFVLLQGRFARDAAVREGVARPRPPRPKPRAAAPPFVEILPPPAATPREIPALTASRIAETIGDAVEAPQGEAMEAGDRWMIFGLIALFMIFGIFLTVVVMIPD